MSSLDDGIGRLRSAASHLLSAANAAATATRSVAAPVTGPPSARYGPIRRALRAGKKWTTTNADPRSRTRWSDAQSCNLARATKRAVTRCGRRSKKNVSESPRTAIRCTIAGGGGGAVTISR